MNAEGGGIPAMFTCSKNPAHDVGGMYSPKFCPECGAPTNAKQCAKCANLLNPEQKFCEQCGLAVDTPTAEPVPEGEHTPY